MPDWPHAPVHRLNSQGAYMVTCGTYLKKRLLNTPGRLDLVCNLLLETAAKYGWNLQAWAVLINHYHFVGLPMEKAINLSMFLSELHGRSARELNLADGTEGRRVWYQYFDTQLTFLNSYYARLHYVHENPVHHGVTAYAPLYRWCSAGWFEAKADSVLRQTVYSFKIDRVKVYDDY